MRITIVYEYNGEGSSVVGFTQDNSTQALNEVFNDIIDRLNIATGGKAEILGIETEKG